MKHWKITCGIHPNTYTIIADEEGSRHLWEKWSGRHTEPEFIWIQKRPTKDELGIAIKKGAVLNDPSF